MGVEHRGTGVGGVVDNGRGSALSPGAVDCDIQPAEPGCSLIDQRSHLVVAANIRTEKMRLCPEVAHGLEEDAPGFLAAS